QLTGKVRAAERAAATADEALVEERRRTATAESAAQAEVRRLKAKLAEAEDAVECARRAARDSRNADETRLWRLLETASGAGPGWERVAVRGRGWRGGWAPPRPAARRGDGAGARAPAPPPPDLSRRGDDPALLDRLLELPRVHLVVDGYNVTKTGYGDLPL